MLLKISEDSCSAFVRKHGAKIKKSFESRKFSQTFESFRKRIEGLFKAKCTDNQYTVRFYKNICYITYFENCVFREIFLTLQRIKQDKAP